MRCQGQDLLEHRALQVCVVNTHASAANLRAVEHEIIVLPVNRRQQRIALRRVLTGQGLVQPRHIVGQRRRERMVRGTPAAMRHLRLVIVCARKQRELRHPQNLRLSAC